MIYNNDKVRIVPFERRHATERYRGWLNDRETCKYNSHANFPYTAIQMGEFVVNTLKGGDDKIVWAIEFATQEEKRPQEDGAYYQPPKKWMHVGNCCLQSIDWINRSAEIAILIGESDARGKGIGLQTCQWMLSHAFNRLNLHRVWLGTAENNIPMLIIANKLGMMREGTCIDGIYQNGKYVNTIICGATKEDKQ